MITVRVLRLCDGIAALQYVAGSSPRYVRLEAGTLVRTDDEARSSGLIDVVCNGSRFAVFAEDLATRAEVTDSAEA